MSVVFVAHPSAELYGSDRQMLESVLAWNAAGHRVVVGLPAAGPLVEALESAGAEVVIIETPVLRRSTLTGRGLVQLTMQMPAFIARAVALLKRVEANHVVVNTLTIPWWLIAARARGIAPVCHVHEAEQEVAKPVRVALAAPLLLARQVVANSQTSLDVLTNEISILKRRSTVVYNGVPERSVVSPLRERKPSDPLEVVLVGRWSPRKGTDVALDALAIARSRGVDARLRLCGSTFEGYEWFEDQLRARAAEADLDGAVEFVGYVDDPSVELAKADVVLVPSRVEPFGNTAVEAMLAGRPVIVSEVQGLAEIVENRVTGLFSEPDNPVDLADQIQLVALTPRASADRAACALDQARLRFSVQRYASAMVSLVESASAERDALAGGLPDISRVRNLSGERTNDRTPLHTLV